MGSKGAESRGSSPEPESGRDTPLPRFLCERCRAILLESPLDPSSQAARCPVCGVEYLATEEYPPQRVGDYLRDSGLSLDLPDPEAHRQQLAALANDARRGLVAKGSYSPVVGALLESLQKARWFIHFTSRGKDQTLMAAVRQLASRIPVRGVFFDPTADLESQSPRAASKLSLRTSPRRCPRDGMELSPYQTLVVVDGLIAFHGGLDLSLRGRIRAAQGLDVMEAVLDPQQVLRLHNRFFSPAWISSDDTRRIRMVNLLF